jgi:hypothetical protein
VAAHVPTVPAGVWGGVLAHHSADAGRYPAERAQYART